jgi:hypothetical protein
MTLSQLLMALLAAYGLCFALVNDKAAFLTNPLKRLPLFRDAEDGENFFGRLLRCPYCTGFHAGWVVWLVFHAPSFLGDADVAISSLISGGILFTFASCTFCYIVDVAAQWFEETSAS